MQANDYVVGVPSDIKEKLNPDENCHSRSRRSR